MEKYGFKTVMPVIKCVTKRFQKAVEVPSMTVFEQLCVSRNQGMTQDDKLSFPAQNCCESQLRQFHVPFIRRISPFTTQKATQVVVQVLVISSRLLFFFTIFFWFLALLSTVNHSTLIDSLLFDILKYQG